MNGRTARQQRSIAIHEAGHAVAHYFLREPIKHVTIAQRGDSGGHVASLGPLREPPADETSGRYLRWIARAEGQITIYLCGSIAQRKDDVRAHRSIHGQSDRHEAYDIASRVVGSGGAILERYLDYRNEVAKAFVDLRWREIVATAEALLDRETLDWLALQRVILKSLGIAQFTESGSAG
jgi:hypothetical protein